MAAVRIHPEISPALSDGRAVVALETAVLTHGLPRLALNRQPRCKPAGWLDGSPLNLETMRAMQRAVHSGGAVPAPIAVLRGSTCIGLDAESIERLAQDAGALKASARDLAPIMAHGLSAGTTVSATLAACAMTFHHAPAIHSAPGHRDDNQTSMLSGIRVFATGGIGGVHRGWSTHADCSADLVELSRTPVCVVCSGPKAVLDVAATAEALESLGVLMVGFQTDVLPQFFSAGDARLRLPHVLHDPAEVADVCRVHWQNLCRSSAVVICQPPPRLQAIAHDEVNQLIEQAITDGARQGVHGPALTPFLLDRVASLSGGQSLEANIALLIENANLAARIARALHQS